MLYYIIQKSSSLKLHGKHTAEMDNCSAKHRNVLHVQHVQHQYAVATTLQCGWLTLPTPGMVMPSIGRGISTLFTSPYLLHSSRTSSMIPVMRQRISLTSLSLSLSLTFVFLIILEFLFGHHVHEAEHFCCKLGRPIDLQSRNTNW